MTAAALAAETGQATMTPQLIVVPLANAGQTLGVMAFIAGGERTYRDEDLVFARDLAHHAALILARGVTVA
jgi:GAF domain-containing protein